MSWQQTGQSIMSELFTRASAIGATFGLGGGVGIVKFLYHCPAPKVGSRWPAAIFDSLQDLVSNKSRIGERLDAEGNTVYIEKPARTKP